MFKISLFFVALCLAISSAAQTDVRLLGKPLHELKQALQVQPAFLPKFLPISAHFSTTQSITSPPKQLLNHSFSYYDSYYEHLGFFCKVELRLEQRSQIPIKFRLGEVQYVERLEGKY